MYRKKYNKKDIQKHTMVDYEYTNECIFGRHKNTLYKKFFTESIFEREVL